MVDPPDSESSTQQSAAIESETPKYTQQEWAADEAEMLEQVKDSKSEYGMSYKQLLLFAAIAIENIDSDRVAQILTETYRRSNEQ